MHKYAKRVIAAGIAAVLTCGGIYGGMIVYKNTNTMPAKVVRIGDMYVESGYYDENMTSGYVMADNIQSEFISSTQEIKDVKVNEGDEVKKGDVLFTYDTTLTEIELEQAANELKKKEFEMQKIEHTLLRIKSLSPSEVKEEDEYTDYENYENYDNSTDFADEEMYTESEETIEYETNDEGNQEEFTEEYEPEQTPLLLSGIGTEDTPYRYLWDAEVLTQEALLQMFAPGFKIITEEKTEDKPEETESEVEIIATVPEAEEPAEPVITTPEDTNEPVVTTEETNNDEPIVTTPEEITIIGQQSTAEPVLEPVQEPVQEPMQEPVLVTESISSIVLNAENEANIEYVDISNSVDLEALPQEIYVILEIHEYNNRLAPVFTEYGLHLTRNGKEVSVQLYKPEQESEQEFDAQESEEAEEEITNTESVVELIEEYPEETDPYYDSEYYEENYNPYYEEDVADEAETEGVLKEDLFDFSTPRTQKEIDEAISDYSKRLLQARLDVKNAEKEFMAKTEEMYNSSVYAEIDGVVKTVRSIEAAKNGDALVVVDAGGGYYVVAAVNEYSRQKGEVAVQSYYTGSEYTGEIKSISDYPYTSEDMYYGGSEDTTYYKATIQLEKNAEMIDGDYVDVIFEKKEEKGIYLDKRFIKEEGLEKYVFVDRDGILKKQIITTGRILPFSTTVLVKSGITSNDKIAFPYGKSVFEGAKTTDASYEDLYSS